MINGESMPDSGNANIVLEGLSPEEQVKVVLAALAEERAEKTELQTKENERLRINNLKGIVTEHDYGEKATELLIMRNMTEEKQDELVPPETLVNFLTIYDLKNAADTSRICVSSKELDKCQKLLNEGKALKDITLDDLVEKKKPKKTTATQTEDSANAGASDAAEPKVEQVFETVHVPEDDSKDNFVIKPEFKSADELNE